MVAAGTTITFRVEGQTGGFAIRDAPELRAQAANALTPFVHLIQMTITSSSPTGILTDPSQWLHWRYSALVIVKTRVDHSSIDDVRSIIAGAFYAGAGAMPSVAIQGEAAGPGFVPEGPDIFKGLFDALTTTTTLVVLGIVGIIWLVAYGPNVKHVAGAVPRL